MKIKILIILLVFSSLAFARVCCGMQDCIPDCPAIKQAEFIQCVESNSLDNSKSEQQVNEECSKLVYSTS